MTSHLMNTYGRLPIALSHGRGCRVWDTEGREYLDGLGGIAVNTLGHGHPKLVPALQDQVAKMIHCSNYYAAPMQETLAAKLCELSGLDAVFFCSTGLEANEGAIKIARKFGHDRGIDRPEIIVYDKAFHGRSIATLSATGNPKVQAGFGPLVEGFVRLALNDLDAVREVARTNPNVVAIFLETIQGEGGINPTHIDTLRGLRQICDEQNWLLMLDEVQCGIGRTGTFYAFEQAGVRPDAIAMAKGLAGGFPIGALWAGERAADLFQPGAHGTTFGGTPLACAAALAVLDVIEREGLLAKVKSLSGPWLAELAKLPVDFPAHVREVRGRGFHVGVEMTGDTAPWVAAICERGMLLVPAGGNVIRFLPPLNATREELARSVEIFRAVLQAHS